MQCDSEVEGEDDGWPGEKTSGVPVGFILSLLRWSAIIGIYERI